MRYGFVGLGHLGRHLAANLARGGFDVGVFDLIAARPTLPIAAGAHWGASVAALARLQRRPDHLPALPGRHRGGHGAGAARHARRQHLDRDEHQ